MIRIMLVDDEQFFIRDAKTTIESVRKDCTVVYEAYDAQDALDNINIYTPDIVFVDIKMPVMDGISLISEIKKINPDVITIILSGYQDFDLARKALRVNADDYLLKPLDGSALNNVLASAIDKIELFRRQHESLILEKLLRNKCVSKPVLDKYFLYKAYCCLIVTVTDIQFSEEELGLAVESFLKPKDHLWILQQQFEIGQIVLFGFQNPSLSVIKDIAQSLFCHSKLRDQRRTIVIYPFFTEISDIYKNIEKARSSLDNIIVPGYDRVYFMDDATLGLDGSQKSLLSQFENNMQAAVWTQNIGSLHSYITSLADYCVKHLVPIAAVYEFLDKIIIMLEQNFPKIAAKADFPIRRNIREAGRSVGNYNELMNRFLQIITDVFIFGENECKKSDNDLMLLIDIYLKENITNKINVDDVCMMFDISQTKMSRIFKEFKGISFVEYFTLMKIETAKNIFRDQPKSRISRVAEMLGFSDVFYFSKVFKKVTSYTPTQYKNL